MADITKPPKKPIIRVTVAMSALCDGVKDVIHHNPAPTGIAGKPPPMRPSSVLFGLTTGAIFRFTKQVTEHIMQQIAQLNDK
jgi:hypothetical protein